MAPTPPRLPPRFRMASCPWRSYRDCCSSTRVTFPAPAPCALCPICYPSRSLSRSSPSQPG